MIAALPMYDRAETRGANDRLWDAVRERLGHGPMALTRGADPWEIWQSPDLLLAQTCGMPYRARLHGKVQLLATPDYGLEGCAPGQYCSALVVRADAPGQTVADFDGARLAYNEALSQSGWAAPVMHPGARFGSYLATGAHRDSARAVAEGRADIAAIDALTWDMIQQWDGFANGLRVLARTAPTPALPYITALGRDPAPIRAALEEAIAGLGPQDRAVLRLRGIVQVSTEDYLAVPTPAPPPA